MLCICGYQKSVDVTYLPSVSPPRSQWKSWKVCVALWVSRWRNGDSVMEEFMLCFLFRIMSGVWFLDVFKSSSCQKM